METLSDKRNDIDYNFDVIYSEKDVKEFIKQLKENFIGGTHASWDAQTIRERIDKLAGEKLI